MSTQSAVQKYDTIVVCGGGCYGGYYVRQLARARAAGAITFERVLVVDRDPDCRVAKLVDAIERNDTSGLSAHGWAMHRAGATEARDGNPDVYLGMPVSLVCEAWEPFFLRWFGEAIAQAATDNSNAVVPSPLMPNLLADWVAARLVAHRPDATVGRFSLRTPPATPWARTGTDGSRYASFATWMCPINCIEPPRCPETKGPRDWSMPAAVRLAARNAADGGTPYDVIAMFTTTHRAFGVGMFDVSDAVAADRAIGTAAAAHAVRVLVASVSHCHGALAELESRR